MSTDHKFGFVTLAGPPNAGKSTLTNKLVGKKISIVSRRPQTTRHRILGVKTLPEAQIVLVDTPGLHQDEKKNLNKVINKTALNSLADVDLIVFMIDYKGWNDQCRNALRRVISRETPIMLIINKIDQLKDKSQLLPLIHESSELYDFIEIMPLSALHLDKDNPLLGTIISHLPDGPPGFPAEQITSQSDKFHVSELVREQTFRLLGKELPYESAVEVIRFDRSDPDFWYIDMVIWVEKSSQKSIVIGKGGSQLKTIGERARKIIEQEYGTRLNLNLWVKQRKGWADNAIMLQSLGYTED